MQRAVWKGASSFGLVHVPVALYPASQEVGIDFDWSGKVSQAARSAKPLTPEESQAMLNAEREGEQDSKGEGAALKHSPLRKD